jgi:uncharacterized protein
MTALQLLVVALSVFTASLTQVLSGFGFALLSVPLMTLAVPTKEAVVISAMLGVGVTTWQAWHGRRHTERAVAQRMVIAAYCGMPIGLWIFVVADDKVLRFALGIAVLLAVVLLAARIDLRHVGSRLDVGTGFISGILNTSLSTNGPPLVFGLQARHLGPDAFRSTINTVFACSNILGITLFVAAGRVTQNGLIAAAVALPAVFLGQFVGYPLRRHLDPERFRYLVLVLLVGAATSAIVSALR